MTMYSKPATLTVPSWAEAMVGNYRRSQGLGSHISNEMIFARIEECRGCEKEDIELAVGDLRDEVEPSR